jgi:hypothetical protein
VAIPISVPADPVATQIVWLSDNEDPTLATFIDLAGAVFADAGHRA